MDLTSLWLEPSSSHPIHRVARVQRPSIQADIRAETVQFDESLRAVMTLLAQALKRTEPELVDVAMVRLDVVADRRRRDDAALQAILAKRVFEQLVLPDPGPASRGVPLVPLRRLAANAHSTQPLHPMPHLKLTGDMCRWMSARPPDVPLVSGKEAQTRGK